MDPNTFKQELEHFSRLDPEMQINAMLVFLFIAGRGRCNQNDLERALGMNSATASRNVSYWTKHKRANQPGMNMVERMEDPMDRRYKILSLNTEGRKFYERLRQGGSPRAKTAANA